MPFCERCVNLVGPVSTLLGVGLRPCPSCGVHACDRCWKRATGACPGCGIALAPASVATLTANVAALPNIAALPDVEGLPNAVAPPRFAA